MSRKILKVGQNGTLIDVWYKEDNAILRARKNVLGYDLLSPTEKKRVWQDIVAQSEPVSVNQVAPQKVWGILQRFFKH